MNELEDVFNLRAHRYLLADFSETFFTQLAALIEQAVGVVDIFNQFGREAATAQANQVETAIGHWFACRHGERRNVLTCARTATNHYVATDMAELMHQNIGADDGEIVHHNLTGNLGGITNDTAAAHTYVVGHVHTFHQKVVAANDGATLGGSASIDGDVLTDGVVVADFCRGFFATEFQILRDGTNDRSREDNVVFPHTSSRQKRHTVHQAVSTADFNVLVDEAKRTDFTIIAEFRLGVYKG